MGSVGLFFAMVFNIFVEIYAWSRFYSKRINYRNPWLYICLVVFSILGLLNYFYISVFIRIFLVSVLLFISNWLIFKMKSNETLVSTLLGQLFLALSDAIGISILAFIFTDGLDFVKNNYFGTLFGNVFVSIIFLAITSLGFVKKIYNKFVSITYNIRITNLVNIGLVLIISINILMALSFYKLNGLYVVIINIVLLFVYSFIIYKSINEKNRSILVQAENDYLMESLHQYEDMVDRQRVDNHENKNQLLIIKNMIDKKDKDVIKYLDSIIKDKKQDDEALYNRVKTIPSGGLQGIIYQKMLVMKDDRIVFSLDVSRDVRKISLDDLSMDDNYKLCKIVGVILDNAIEASKDVRDKCVMISLYLDDDNLIIDVSNRFNNEFDISKLDDEGYTTKGDGHGYGLSLVKKTVSESNIFENERSVRKNIFKQVIKVKIKNT